MENNLGIFGTVAPMVDPGGGGIPSGCSDSGSLLTASKEDNMIISSEASSSYPDESELELGLGLSLGGGSGAAVNFKPPSWGQYARILTAKDFPSMGSNASPPSSSSSSSVTKNASSAGTKRAADSVSPPRKGASAVVGWPPVRAYRMNSLVNQVRSPPAEEFNSTGEEGKRKIGVVDTVRDASSNAVKEQVARKVSQFVKVNMDGILIGRKVDLGAHSCYKTLAQTLEHMFGGPTTSMCTKRQSMKNHDMRTEVVGTSKLLDGSAEFVLTYEDKEGDWMLVGDVPWGMFISSVKKLRITRTSEANGLAPPSTRESNARKTSKPV